MKTPLKIASCLIGLSAVVSVSAETMNLFSRSSSIGEDRVWTVSEFSEGKYTLDMVIKRWDANAGQWTGCKSGISCSENSQTLTFNSPIYSPTDGVVRACWRGAPDNPKLNVKLNKVQGNTPDGVDWQIPAAGNVLFIETPDGSLLTLAHFKQNTIPNWVCPKNDADGLVNTTALTPPNSIRDALMINEADRPVIQKGQFLGRAGNSGNSTGPHMHTSFATITGSYSHANNKAFKFEHVWAQRYKKHSKPTANGWYRYKGAAMEGYQNNSDYAICKSYGLNNPECNYTMFHPSPFLHRVEAAAGVISQVEPVFLTDTKAVTAVIDSNHKLKLISWRVNGITSLVRLDDISGEMIKDLKVAKVSNSQVLVAMKTMNNKLKLLLYKVSNNGSFLKQDSYLAGSITKLSLAKTNARDDKFVTSVGDSHNRLKLIVWDVDYISNSYQIVRNGSAIGQGLDDSLESASAKNFNGVYTAYRGLFGRLQLIPWKISSDGLTITKGAGYSGNQIKSELSVVGINDGTVVGAVDADDKLLMLSFKTPDSGNFVSLREVESAGSISEVELLNPSLAGSNVVSVVRDGVGKKRLIGWTVKGDGTNLRRDGSSIGPVGSHMTAATVTKSYPNLTPRDLILTTMIDEKGDLKLMSWDTNLNE